MKDPLGKLFPFLGLIVTAMCFIVFLTWKRSHTENKDSAKKNKPVKPAKPTTRRPPPTTEGFQNVPQTNTPVLPQYMGPVIRFVPTVNDHIYDAYELENLYPSKELMNATKLIVLPEAERPDYGNSLTQFDATTIDNIPWDSDNTTYLKEDILWGFVSENASKSIFMKTYTLNLLQDASNYTDSPDPQIYSPILGIATRDQGVGAALQAADMAVGVTGQLALTSLNERIMKDFISKNMDLMDDLLAKNQSRAGSFFGDFKNKWSFVGMSEGRIQEVAQKLVDKQRAKMLQDSIDAKNIKGIALTEAEETFKASKAAKAKTVKGRVGKTLTAVKDAIRALGARIGNALKPILTKIIGPTLTRLAIKATSKFATAMGGIIAGLVSGNVLLALTPICPPCAVSGAAMVAINTALMIIDIIFMVITLTLVIVLPTIFDKGLENGGTCNVGGKNGKALDRIITDPVGYFIFANLTNVGGIMDAFGPYVCYEEGGGMYFRQGLIPPQWSVDSSLSLYKHKTPPALTMRGSRTWWTDSAMDPNLTDPNGVGWKKTGNTWRKNCEGGTWASSDVDALCNAASFVPKTYTKGSKVPRTVAKESRVPNTWAKDTYITTYMREIRWRNVRWECGNCGANETKPLAGCLCYTNCASYNYVDAATGIQKTFTTTINTDLHCAAQCNQPGAGKAGPTTTSFMCTDNSCRDGYDFVAGVCWKQCSATQTSMGALCRDNCNANEDTVAGVCWKRCNAWPGSNYQDVGALCREVCGGDTGEDVAGICWGKCKPGDTNVGMLCREKCPDGMTDKAGICWTRDTYGRESIVISSVRNDDDGYQPRDTADLYAADYKNTKGVDLDWCDFSSQTMLDRMAQFYYNQSIHNATIDNDTKLVTYEYIIMFYGLIASSELSCDVACVIKSVKYNPITGGEYDEVIGAYYPEDPGNSVSYRRFYFIKDPADPQGIFKVTGCTHVDYTAPDAMVRSTDPGVDPIISLPKTISYNKKSQIQFSVAAFLSSSINVGVGLAAGMAGGAGMARQVAGGLTGGVSGQALSKVISEALMSPPLGLDATKSVALYNGVPYLNTNNDAIWANFGPIYEYNASIGVGVVPNINFCEKIITTSLLCTDKNILRDTLDEYHRQNPGKRIKTVKIIEPRGSIGDSGCYYKWDEVDYNAQTNTEGNIIAQKEVLYKYIIPDKSTCAFAPTGVFVTDLTNYPIRNYHDTINNTTVYPTRNVVGIPVFQARYVRVLPSTSAPTRTLQLSQIVVYDSAGTNIAINKRVAVTSTAPGFTTSSATLVDGTLSARTGTTNTWQNNNTTATSTDYFQIDLGQNFLISSVMYIGRSDATAVENNMGVRIQLFYTVEASATPVVEKKTTSTLVVQNVSFTTPQITPKNPLKPFVIPKPLPPKTNLGGAGQCPVRCEDKPQIDAFIKAYNDDPTNTSKVLKVLKAATASNNRCDYEVEVMTVDPIRGNKIISKEHIKQKVDISGSPIANTGIVYGRYVRLRPPTTGGDGYLRVSQVVVTSAQKPISIGQPVYATSYYSYSGIKNITELPSSYVNQNVPLNATGRYVRVYASSDTSVADKANFALSYVGVFNGGANISKGKSATSSLPALPGSALPASIVNLDGANIKAYNWTAANTNMVWANNPVAGANRDLNYFQIDLGSVQNVTSVKIITRADLGADVTGSGTIVSGGDRTKGIRIAVLMTPTDALVYASTAARSSAATPVTVDANPSNAYEARDLPNIWQNASQTARTTDYWELDLGSIQPIDSIKYYPGVTKTTTGVRVQVLTENGIASIPTYDKAISADANPFNLIQFNKCDFKYARATADMMGDFIQDNTPPLSAIDTKDGVSTFKGIGNNIVNLFNNMVKPLTDADPLGILNKKATSSDNTANKLLGAVAANQKLSGCPTLKCSDAAVLSPIMARYNELNATPKGEQFGVETNTMTQILKAATSGLNTCDIVFSELYNAYEDFLYPPTETKTTVKAKRFTLNNVGNCVFQVDRGADAIRDISLNEVTIRTNDSILSTVFSNTQCKLDCRNDAYLTSIKQKLAQAQTPSNMATYTSITQSIAAGPTACEYRMKKNVTTMDSVTNESSTDTDLETIVKATFTLAPNTCTYTVTAAKDYDVANITSDTRSGEEIYYLNGVAVELPYLYNYDRNLTGSLVDETVKIL